MRSDPSNRRFAYQHLDDVILSPKCYSNAFTGDQKNPDPIHLPAQPLRLLAWQRYSCSGAHPSVLPPQRQPIPERHPNELALLESRHRHFEAD
jgi:hypothetical protein